METIDEEAIKIEVVTRFAATNPNVFKSFELMIGKDKTMYDGRVAIMVFCHSAFDISLDDMIDNKIITAKLKIIDTTETSTVINKRHGNEPT